jgi:hypothetical protein
VDDVTDAPPATAQPQMPSMQQPQQSMPGQQKHK